MRELTIPDGVFEYEDGVEFLRFWVAGGEEHISLNVGAMGDRELHQWGMMLADMSIHIIRAMRLEDPTLDQDSLRAQLEQGYLGRLKDKTPNHSGSFIGRKN